MLRYLLAALLCLSTVVASAADDKKISAEEFLGSLKFQQGDITLPGGIATLKVPAGFRYLAPADAERLLVEGWGNPAGAGAGTLGMILPVAPSPLEKAGWGVVVTYDKDGHVKDDDADSIKYDELLKDMQESIQSNNEERTKQGHEAMQLVGWAEKPSYDKASHKMFWAKELNFGKAPTNTLNYNVRVLGREGVLVLNAVGSMEQLGQLKTDMKQVIAFTDFTDGNRYSDFDSKTDKVAEYGLAALVAGGVAAKLGFFGKIFALLLAFKKLLLLGLAAAGTWVYKLFGRKKASDQPAE